MCFYGLVVVYFYTTPVVYQLQHTVLCLNSFVSTHGPFFSLRMFTSRTTMLSPIMRRAMSGTVSCTRQHLAHIKINNVTILKPKK